MAYKLPFSKSIYLPVSDNEIIVINVAGKYSGKTDALRGPELSYLRSNPNDKIEMDNPKRNDYLIIEFVSEK